MYYHMLQIMGRATADPKLQESKTGKKYCKIPIAVNQRKKKNEEEVEDKAFFYDVLLFGKRAENAVKRVKKADLILAFGKPEVEAYLSKSKKEPKFSFSLLADNWQVFK